MWGMYLLKQLTAMTGTDKNSWIWNSNKLWKEVLFSKAVSLVARELMKLALQQEKTATE